MINEPFEKIYSENKSDDDVIKDLLISCTSRSLDLNIHDDTPTVCSLQDTIDLIIKKYGEDWRDYAECKSTVIWTSKMFNLEHVKEVVPDLYHLCEEYHTKHTVNGKKFEDNFYLLAFYVIDPNTDKFEK